MYLGKASKNQSFLDKIQASLPDLELSVSPLLNTTLPLKHGSWIIH